MQILPTGPAHDIGQRRFETRVFHHAVAHLLAAALAGQVRDHRRGGARVQGGSDHAGGRQEQKLAVGGRFQALRDDRVHAFARHQHVEQILSAFRLHVNRRHREVIQLARIQKEARRLLRESCFGGLHQVEVLAQRRRGHAAQRRNHPAPRVGHQEESGGSGNPRPQFARAIADGGLVAGAERRAHIRHAGQQAAHGVQQFGARVPQRCVGVKAALHLRLQAVRHALGDIAQYDFPRDGEQHRDRHRSGEHDLGQQRQARESQSHCLGAPG